MAITQIIAYGACPTRTAGFPCSMITKEDQNPEKKCLPTTIIKGYQCHPESSVKSLTFHTLSMKNCLQGPGFISLTKGQKKVDLELRDDTFNTGMRSRV